jgi:hypothetical protein
MIREIQQVNSAPVSDSLSVQEDQEIINIFQYIDFSIGKFHDYYMIYKDSKKENRITDLLVSCFEECLYLFNNGYFSIRFSKNPTEDNSTRELDIGVYPRKIRKSLKPIISFEAKRLYASSHSNEYVNGITGGIERFKRCKHAAEDKVCEMIGYVQTKDANFWFSKINDLIDRLAKENKDETIDWKDENEKLSLLNSFIRVQKYSSLNYRKPKNDFICIFHYFIELI